MSEAVICAQGLSKRYRIGNRQRATTLREGIIELARAPLRLGRRSAPETIWALRDVSFEIAPGEVVGVIGRNGAGKSTLLKILARITEPTEGRAEVRGRVGSLLEVGTGFHSELTGRENIFLNGAILGMKRAEILAKFDEIVAFAEVEKFIDTPVKHYSSGMYLRLAFAVAAYLEPDILLVDEVLAVGDASFQKKCLGKMGEVSKSGRTVLFVSHNMPAVRNLCPRAILLCQGLVHSLGPTDEVLRQYLGMSQTQEASPARELYRDANLGLAIRAFQLLNENGQVVPVLETGRPATFRFVVETTNRRANVTGSVGVNSLIDDGRICVFYSPLTGSELALEPPLTNLDCHVPKFPLMPGRYRLTLKLTSGAQTLAYIPAAVEVDVASGDFFGTGRLPEAPWAGHVLVEHEWRHDPDHVK